MTIHLIGSEGFIGKAIQRVSPCVKLVCWSHSAEEPSQYFDLFDPSSWQPLLLSTPKTALLLSWPGLPNYSKHFHLTENLPAFIKLVDSLIQYGCENLVVAGTCYEYGLQNGQLSEEMLTNPSNIYSIAKDSARRAIEQLCETKKVRLVWARIFYPYGVGQNPRSLIPSLRQAIKNGDTNFPMSSGRQIRDFIPVDVLADQLLFLAQNKSAQGIFNCGTGQPRSLLEIVEKIIADSGASITPKRDFYPDRQDEPLAFWADMSKLNDLIKSTQAAHGT